MAALDLAIAPALAPRSTVLITPHDVQALIDAGRAPIILAVRSDDTSAPRPFESQPRIPGALDASLADDFSDPTHPTRGSRPLPDLGALQARARRWGVTQDSVVVVYDHDGNLQAARAWWVLTWAGLSGARILDGGFAGWVRAGLPLASAPGQAEASDVTLSAGHLPVLDADQAAAMAGQGVLLDTRISPNYEGGPTAPGERPRGHIPGAVSVPAAANLDEAGAFLDPKALAELYAKAGVDPARPVGVYCGAGVSAAHAVAALASIGVPAALYPGSWSAWSSDPSRPVAIGPEPGAPSSSPHA
jgi:thiosulfate/3-mercaptopyruvate sulfurtransferase